MSRLRRAQPATVIACVALFVALGGTGLAAVNHGTQMRPYFVVRRAVLSHKHPEKVAIAECYRGGHALKGGFLGATNVSLVSDLPYPYPPDPFAHRSRHTVPSARGWGVTAEVEPGTRAGDAEFYAWAICG